MKGRPLTLVHCPAGLAAPCMYLKHAKQWGPNALRRVKIQEKTKVGEYLVADNIEAVVSLAQMGIVEIHTWNSTVDDVERPNRIVWDLDPGPEVTWKQVVAAAKVVRDVLKTLGLESWVKTTGGRGLHVVVPIKPARDWSECLDFARDVSEAIERTDPHLHDHVRQGRARAEDPDRLPAEQPDEHVGLRVLAARPTGSDGVDAAGVAGVERRAGAVDAADRAAAIEAPQDRSVGRDTGRHHSACPTRRYARYRAL